MSPKNSWTRFAVTLFAPDPDTAEELACLVFTEQGLTGVSVERPGETGFVEPGQEDAVHRITAFLPDDDQGRELEAALRDRLLELADRLSARFEMESAPLEDAQWEEAWKEHFHPVFPAEGIVIAPSWEAYEKKPDEILITIDPGQAFGTGGHATTSLCVKFLKQFIKPGEQVLDVGTGSGVLLIAAYRLGASLVAGCDCDLEACLAARKNLTVNRVPSDQSLVFLSDLDRAVRMNRFSLVVANIEEAPIKTLVNGLVQKLVPGTRLVFSGILADRAEGVRDHLEGSGLEVTHVEVLDEWAAFACFAP